jgi:hypothetical protein
LSKIYNLWTDCREDTAFGNVGCLAITRKRLQHACYQATSTPRRARHNIKFIKEKSILEKQNYLSNYLIIYLSWIIYIFNLTYPLRCLRVPPGECLVQVEYHCHKLPKFNEYGWNHLRENSHFVFRNPSDGPYFGI